MAKRKTYTIQRDVGRSNWKLAPGTRLRVAKDTKRKENNRASRRVGTIRRRNGTVHPLCPSIACFPASAKGADAVPSKSSTEETARMTTIAPARPRARRRRHMLPLILTLLAVGGGGGWVWSRTHRAED